MGIALPYWSYWVAGFSYQSSSYCQPLAAEVLRSGGSCSACGRAEEKPGRKSVVLDAIRRLPRDLLIVVDWRTCIPSASIAADLNMV